MAGFFTPGLPLATGTTLTSAATIPVDTNLGQGINPQSVAASPAQIASLAFQYTAQTYASTLTIDASAVPSFSITLTGALTLTLTNMEPGQIMYGKVTQDGTGSRVITVAAGSGGATVVSGTPLSTAASSVDLIAIQNVGTYAAPIFAYWPVAKAFV